MITESRSYRIRTSLSDLMASDVREKKAENLTEILERALCQFYGVQYVKVTTKQPKSGKTSIPGATSPRQAPSFSCDAGEFVGQCKSCKCKTCVKSTLSKLVK